MEQTEIHKVGIEHIRQMSLADVIGNDFALFRDINDVPFPSFSWRCEALCFAVCLKGTARARFNFRDYDIGPGTMVVVHPDVITERLSSSEDFSGLLLALSVEFVGEVIPSVQQLYPLSLWIREQPCLHITPEEVELFRQYHEFLRRRTQVCDPEFAREVIKGLLASLFYEIYAIYRRVSADGRSRARSRKEELFHNFIRAVCESCREERRVESYASRLCVSPKYLSTVVKEVSGRTAGELIAELVIMEAKALLKSTGKSVQQVADELHFANQSFFGRYFKQHTGLSPKAFRER